MNRPLARARSIALVAAVVLGGLGTPARASATPINPPVANVYKVQLRGPSKVCTNQYARFTVRITHFGLYNSTTAGVQQYRAWGNIAGTVTVTGLGPPLSQAVGPNGAGFRTRWSTPGTRTMTATASGLPTFPAGNSPTADPDTLQVEVKDCDYTIQQLSIWYHMPEGWNWWVGAIVPPTRITPDPNGQPTTYRASFDGFAIAGRHDCDVTTTVTGVFAMVSLYLPATDKVHYRIAYTPGNADTKVVCNGLPGGNPNGPLSVDAIEKDLDVGDICWPLPFTCLARAWPVVSIHNPHIAHAISDLRGITYVILEKN